MEDNLLSRVSSISIAHLVSAGIFGSELLLPYVRCFLNPQKT